MRDLPLLSEAQMHWIERYFPLSHGVPRVDDCRVLSGIIYVIKTGLRWCDALCGLWTAQDALQPLCTLEQTGCLQPDICCAGQAGWRA